MKKQIASERYRITNVDLWNATEIQTKVDVEIEAGVIKAITKSTDHKSTRAVLMPAGVDPQVHLRVPGQPDKELATTGLAAAVGGGIGAILTMPNTKPVIDNIDTLAAARKEVAAAQQEYPVTVLFSAAMTKGQKGQEPVDFAALARAGIAAFTDDGVGLMSDALMREVFTASQATGLPVLQHAEMMGHGCVLAPGPVQQQLGLSPYDESAEYEMVARDLSLLREFPRARYHVLHVSSARTLELVAAAKATGALASCEVSPHHLYFCSDDIDPQNSSFKMNPPLRSPTDRARLRTALEAGAIDFVATDHAPHEAAAKTNNFKTAAFGTTGLETSLLTLLYLVQRKELSPKRLVQVFSSEPARFLGISERFGTLKEGSVCNAVLVSDLDNTFTITEQDLYSKSKNNCFLGAGLPGRIRAVILERSLFGTLT